MDFGTLIGLGAGVALVLGSILMSSDIGSFIDYPSILLVGGGSVCAALVSFPIQNVVGVARVVKNCFFVTVRSPGDLIADFVKYADVARRDGILALEGLTDAIVDPFVVQGIRMAVDGTAPEKIQAILLNDLEALEARHGEGKALFENISKYAPAFGMIGTLVGLVIMLKNMANPSAIGPAMAVALLTTLYGALISNMFAGPMAEKLSRRSKEEMMLKMIVIKGIMSIQAGDNPRIVGQKLKTFLPHRQRQTGRGSREAA